MKLKRNQFHNAYARRSDYLIDLVNRILNASHPALAAEIQFFRFKIGPRVGEPCCIGNLIVVPTNIDMKSFVRSVLHEARHAWDYFHGDLYLLKEEKEAVAETFAHVAGERVYHEALNADERAKWDSFIDVAFETRSQRTRATD